MTANPKEQQKQLAATDENYRNLLELAREASKKSYCPYSEFPVGAALLSGDGRVFTGCNVENASYGGTICAERTALVKAISEDCRDFSAIAVFCEKAHDAWPCGACRQFMSEFGVNIEVITEAADGSLQVLKVADLLPHMFGPSDLRRPNV
jgi:cytidine deaminase